MKKRLILGGIVACFAGLFYIGYDAIYAPQSFDNSRRILIEKGDGAERIGRLLFENDLTLHPLFFYIASVLEGKTQMLKPGEYEIPPYASVVQIIELIASGKSIIHKITIPEGATVHDIITQINTHPTLSGPVVPLVKEGSLLPETYLFTYGKTRVELVSDMSQAMTKTVEKIWNTRSEACALNNPEDLVILASIVEKETGVASERARIARVFFNRLRLKMRLQSDPTTIYGLTKGQGKLERPLTRADLDTHTPFNTYTIEALPPTPIACPGKAALEATAHPTDGDDLYFVADGKGGHAFAASLTEHNTNVAAWRHFKKTSAKNK